MRSTRPRSTPILVAFFAALPTALLAGHGETAHLELSPALHAEGGGSLPITAFAPPHAEHGGAKHAAAFATPHVEGPSSTMTVHSAGTLVEYALEYSLQGGAYHEAGDAEPIARRGRRRGRGPSRGYALESVIAACERYSNFRSSREHCIRHAPRIVGRRPADAVRACAQETTFSSGFQDCIEAAARFRVAPAPSIRACGDATSFNSHLVRCVESASRYSYDPEPIIAYCDRRHATGSRVISCVDDHRVRRRR